MDEYEHASGHKTFHDGNGNPACAGDFPDRYLMTARKKGGPAASQFVITMGDGDESEESNVVGRLKATSRTSEEFQVHTVYFCTFLHIFSLFFVSLKSKLVAVPG